MENAVSKAIGMRIREVRLANGMSRNQLGSLIGVSGQQLQKYEKGQNRISIDMLFVIANILKINWIDLCENLQSSKPVTTKARLLMELCREFTRMTNVKQQVSLVAIARTLN